MAKKKACKKCKLFVEGDKCPSCGTSSFTTSWQGRLFINDVNNSMIGEKIGIKVKGEYAIKVR
ncbi:DNA-directed RNA polymerase subunit E'' [Candidatus Woesearchaeota archaeon]|jgi:RNA polymerase subunit RPABC4/transcription elongation factor Spt4|nr:DNA-directed RNA polymerase subunit E'' [Candidatus Woesearchaeota archaeon]MBT4111217.1 DNA-directed RNA polymerase subunit E'' [Candidatus Woesearchaeota archaeon]MBT4336797.1 DNA-directed RNA polymerase subunit E'' [Candidatus Woesearchaeota archaeon]MBT4469465.1 DNA-directed RNA polymerase subunit E'' [Candidatus Woesearchaeota archaeon]MBT6744140.1 DNA-directed RNA polymerase subunit E'' [Candidatus Woesearchaeota archaeon]